MTSTAIHENEIVAYYDNCEVDYAIVWHLKSQLCMHYGYWEKSTRRLREALHLMNCKVAEAAAISSKDVVLDAGCGVGGSSIFLAKNYGCRVQGITLSQNQVETCRQNAAAHSVNNLVQFDRQNYLSTNFPDQSFDVVWAIESSCYAFDKKDFLTEAFRLLRPGGRFVVADFFTVPMKNGSPEARLMQQWTDTWAIKSYAVTEDFQRDANAVGFINVAIKDITKNVLPSIKRLYYCYFPGIVITSVLQLFGFRNRLQTANTKSCLYQYKAWKQGLWKYNIITGIKKPHL